MSLVSFLVGGAWFFVGWRLELLAAWSVFRGSRLGVWSSFLLFCH
jgi:hypothetical protein